MKNTLLLSCLILAGIAHADDTLRSPSGIVVRSCDHDAGAICSIKWNGKEFINDRDHGRQLQSAISFDGMGESYNPTEAGASYLTDGYNPRPSSSVLMASDVTDDVLSTISRMAYWKPVKGQRTSNILFSKRVQFGIPSADKKYFQQVMSYEVAYSIPSNEKHSSGTFEALTAYIPAEFSEFWAVDVKRSDSTLRRLSDGPGEQSLPIVMATPDQQYAIAIYSPGSPQAAYPEAGYGRWRFATDKVVKINNVYRINNPKGTLRFKEYVVIGTLQSVVKDLIELQKHIGK